MFMIKMQLKKKFIKHSKNQFDVSLEGYYTSILAYGQTGTGKTYTMEGFKYSPGDSERGIIPRSIEEILSIVN